MNINSLTTEIKKCLQKIRDEERKAAVRCDEYCEKHAREAGVLLAKLKLENAGSNTTWGNCVRAKFGIKRSYANDLIRIGKGEITLKSLRAENAKRVQEHRRRTAVTGNGRSRSRSGPKPLYDTDGIDYSDRKPRLDEFKRADGGIKKACDYDPYDPQDVAATPHDTDEEIWERMYWHRVKEAKDHAEECTRKSNKFRPETITDEMIDAAQNAADAWLDTVSTMKAQRVKVATNGQTEKAYQKTVLRSH